MNSKKYLIAMSLTIAAILCFVAGQPRFGFCLLASPTSVVSPSS